MEASPRQVAVSAALLYDALLVGYALDVATLREVEPEKLEIVGGEVIVGPLLIVFIRVLGKEEREPVGKNRCLLIGQHAHVCVLGYAVLVLVNLLLIFETQLRHAAHKTCCHLHGSYAFVVWAVTLGVLAAEVYAIIDVAYLARIFLPCQKIGVEA